MNFIHLGDLEALKVPIKHPEPINLDRVLYLHTWDTSSYHKLYFKMTDGNDHTWDFKNSDELIKYHGRILDLMESKDLSRIISL